MTAAATAARAAIRATVCRPRCCMGDSRDRAVGNVAKCIDGSSRTQIRLTRDDGTKQ